jgi:integrase
VTAPKRRFFTKARKPDKKPTATHSEAQTKGNSVQRKRFQKGSVYMNASKTMWLGAYSAYVIDSHGVEQRVRKQLTLSPVKVGDTKISKRDAMRLLQPSLDRVNSGTAQVRKSTTFDAFSEVWQRDYLSLQKPATQSATRSYLKRLRAAFGNRDMRSIGAGDVQRLIAKSTADGLSPKTIRSLWNAISQIWQAALAQTLVDAVLPKPKLPRNPKKKARFFTLRDVSRIIDASEGEHRVFYWLLAETGIRSGELAGLRLEDIDGERLTVNQSVWHGKAQTPKTDNSVRTLGLSPQLASLLGEQIARQRSKGHGYVFSSENGTPWDMNVYRRRKLAKLLTSLGIAQAGFHAFRHFNVSLMDALHVPLKTIQERIGHALTGSFTLDVYGGKPEFERNIAAGNRAGAEIQAAIESLKPAVNCCLTTINEKGSGAVISQAA